MKFFLLISVFVLCISSCDSTTSTGSDNESSSSSVDSSSSFQLSYDYTDFFSGTGYDCIDDFVHKVESHACTNSKLLNLSEEYSTSNILMQFIYFYNDHITFRELNYVDSLELIVEVPFDQVQCNGLSSVDLNSENAISILRPYSGAPDTSSLSISVSLGLPDESNSNPEDVELLDISSGILHDSTEIKFDCELLKLMINS
jgi:hypothetical protein